MGTNFYVNGKTGHIMEIIDNDAKKCEGWCISYLLGEGVGEHAAAGGVGAGVGSQHPSDP